MQSLRSLLVPAVLTTWMLHASGLLAQDPTPQEPSSNAPRAESPTTKEPAGQEPAARPEARGPRRRGGRSGMVVIEAGMVHPVSGPPIKDGVVLIRGERIFAIGLQGDLELPPNTKVYRFPNGHVYPGLIDASTDAFTDAALQRDGSLNGGSVIADGLVWTDSRDDHLVEHGVTTAYVSVHSGSQLPGQGAIVRPRKDGFEVWEDHQQAALQLRMNTGQVASHALQRQAQLEAVDKLFEGLDTYREEQEKFDKELEKYNSDFEKYLAYHSKKNGKDKDAKKDDKAPAKDPEAKTEAAEATPEASGETRRGSRRGSGRPPRREPPKDGSAQAELTAEAFEEALATVMALVGQPSVATPESNAAANNQDPKPQGATPSGTKPTNGEKPGGSPETKPGAAAAKKDDGPKRPTYPKKPNEDLQKEALNEVLDGTLPLRVEAHRRDELMAALRLQREREVPLLVLEQAYGADSLTQQIARQGATVVLTDVLPGSLGVPGDTSNPYAKFDPTGLPKQLNEAGVPFAIAGGSARMSALLPMMAAAAIGRGLSEDAALRAITLTPAEILGIAKDTGSLTRNKFADVIVTDGPLFASDSRMLLVVAKGRTEYEAK